ncbi:transposase [Bradyrhizobium elkanii]|nr:transposase [Bradyrhizobium elkanii]WLA44548.1 transposase [Bradyrhizobium elkanii]
MPKVSRLEVVSTGARRRWTLEEKQPIVAESYSGPRLASVTARRNGLSTSQLFTWRRLARDGRLAEDAAPFRAAAAIWSRFFGIMGWALPEASSSGLRRRTARYQSQRRRWPICWKGSTGEIHN